MASGPKTPHAAPLQNASRTALIVLGMHRSGTSVLTRVLNLMGADLPETLIGPSPNNPTGYWESRVLRDFNDRLLALTGSRWDDWRALPDGWERSPNVAEFAQEATQLLETEFSASRFLVLKDPRVSRLMPFWDTVLDTAGFTPRPILALRNPMEVAASLERRNGFAPELSHLLWLRYMLEAERATRGKARVVVSYDSIMQNWAGTIDRITKALDLIWVRGPEQVSAEVSALISPEHRHHVSDPAGLDSPLVSDWLSGTYAIFDHWATKQERKGDYARLDAIRADLDTAAPAFAPLVDAMLDTKAELNKRLTVIQDNKARIQDLANAGRAAEKELAAAQRSAAKELADMQRAAQAAQAEVERRTAEAEAARAEAENERQQKEKANAELEAHIAARAEAQIEAETLQTRVMQKLQQEIEIEAARADALEEDFKTRLQSRTKAQTKTLRTRLEAQTAELEVARSALAEQEAALIALQTDSAEQASHLTALQNGALERDMVMAEQEAALAAARASLAEQETALTALQDTLAITEDTVRSQADTLAERDTALAEQEARLAALQDTLTTTEGTVRGQADTLAEREATLAEQQAQLTAVQEALAAAEDTVRSQADTLAETQSALAQKDAELTDTRGALQQAETAHKDADQHAQTLDRINQSLKREADLEHAHVQSLTRENTNLQKSAAEAEAAIARLRAAHDSELGTLKAQLAQATAQSDTRHSELAQLTNLLMQTEAQARQAESERDAIQAQLMQVGAERQALEEALATMRTTLDKTERNRTAAVESETKARVGLDKAQADVATLRAAQADLTAIIALLQPQRHTRFWRRSTGQLRREIDTIRRSGLFDADWYLRANPDVAETGMDPLTHFILYGLAEGRAPRAPQASSAPVTPTAATPDDTRINDASQTIAASRAGVPQ